MSYSSALASSLGGNFGANGAVYESGTDAVTGNFVAITALAASVFSALTATDWGGDSTASLPLPAGMTIYGSFTGFTLSSGKVLAYKGPYSPT